MIIYLIIAIVIIATLTIGCMLTVRTYIKTSKLKYEATVLKHDYQIKLLSKSFDSLYEAVTSNEKGLENVRKSYLALANSRTIPTVQQMDELRESVNKLAADVTHVMER